MRLEASITRLLCADVALRPQILAGINDLATLDQKVELVIRPHRDLREARSSGAGERGRARDELAA
jgi:hypothetical protein